MQLDPFSLEACLRDLQGLDARPETVVHTALTL
jgi:hypothetical protein